MDRSQRILFRISWLCLAVVAMPAAAQEPRFELYAGVGVLGVIVDSSSGDNPAPLVENYQYRLGLLYSWRPALSTELSATYGPDSDVATADGAVLYHFRSHPKWNPFVGGGLHYASLSYDVGHQELEDHGTAIVVVGGVDWQFSRLVGLRFEARSFPLKLTGDHEVIDDGIVGSAGFTFRF
jgi:outer membrane protein with beta-barrel domain